jgi:O6-methylguanine-DNA--protein-cysteine methyltransferase
MLKNGEFRVPCHRVVNTNGKVGGFAKGVGKKIEMLKGEGVAVENGFIL